MRRILPPHPLAVLLAATLLVACGAPSAGSPQPPGPSPAPTTAPTTAQPTAAPAASAEAPSPAAAVSTAAPPTQPAAPAPSAAPSGPLAGIPQSRTPEGYQVLGNPDAPVTLVMYSDFL